MAIRTRIAKVEIDTNRRIARVTEDETGNTLEVSTSYYERKIKPLTDIQTIVVNVDMTADVIRNRRYWDQIDLQKI